VVIQELEQSLLGDWFDCRESTYVTTLPFNIPMANCVADEIEKQFLVVVIRDLLTLVELKRGKDNKAIVASNIMYALHSISSILTLQVYRRSALSFLACSLSLPYDGAQQAV